MEKWWISHQPAELSQLLHLHPQRHPVLPLPVRGRQLAHLGEGHLVQGSFGGENGRTEVPDGVLAGNTGMFVIIVFYPEGLSLI